MNPGNSHRVTRLDSLTVVRALAITLVVANHALVGPFLHGGLNALMLVSGIAMASFAFHGSTAQTLGAMRRFAVRIVLPAFVLALLWGLVVGKIYWPEIALFSNWITRHRVVYFPIWYPQVILQMMLVLGLVFWLFDLTPKFEARPLRTSLLALGVAVAIALASYSVWDTAYLSDKLPHLLAWNFVLGWVYWALMIRGGRSLRNRLLFVLIAVVCEVLIFVLAGADRGEARLLWLTLFVLLLVGKDDIALPSRVAHVISLISQATFFVFLLHHYGFWALGRVARWFGYTHFEVAPVLMWISGMVCPIVLWAGVTAVRRTWVRWQASSANAIGGMASRPAAG